MRLVQLGWTQGEVRHGVARYGKTRLGKARQGYKSEKAPLTQGGLLHVGDTSARKSFCHKKFWLFRGTGGQGGSSSSHYDWNYERFQW
jgi:hypothetical protein